MAKAFEFLYNGLIWLTARKLKNVCTPQILDSIIKGCDEDTELVSFSPKVGSKSGDNYSSNLYNVELVLKKKNSEEKEENTLSIMLKTMPRDPIRRRMLRANGGFVKDANMYKIVLPAFESLQKGKGLKESDIFKEWPRCYSTFNDGVDDFLAMEDLKVDGYKMGNRLLGLDTEHVTMVMVAIAKFHAISFAMYGGKGEDIMSAHPWLEEKMFLSEDALPAPFRMMLRAMIRKGAGIVRKSGEEGAEKGAADIEKVASAEFKFMTKFFNLIAGIGENYSYPKVITHGDYWINNILFKYGENGSVPENLKLLDFQQARCSSRCVDLGHFFHTSLPADAFNFTMEQNYLKIYHEAFCTFLKKLGVEDQQGFEGFLEEYEFHKFYGVAAGLLMAHQVFSKIDMSPELKDLATEADLLNEGTIKAFLKKLSSEKLSKSLCNLAINHLPRCKELKE